MCEFIPQKHTERLRHVKVLSRKKSKNREQLRRQWSAQLSFVLVCTLQGCRAQDSCDALPMWATTHHAWAGAFWAVLSLLWQVDNRSWLNATVSNHPVISTFGIVPYTLWTVHPLHKTANINSILGFPSHTTRLQKSYLIMISYTVFRVNTAHT